MKLALRLIALSGLAYLLYSFCDAETISHWLFPSVPDDVSLSPSQVANELTLQQCLGMLVGAILLSIGLFFIFKNKILPKISQVLLDWFTGQNDAYIPEDDELVQILQQLPPIRTLQDLAPLDELCERQPKRLRHWMEYAHLAKTQVRDAEASITILQRAYQLINLDEDKALILYRIANTYEQELANLGKAHEYYARAASRYPRCTYGKMAAEKGSS